MPEWSAEVVVDEGLARRLIGQFPDVRLGSLRPLAAGWDNAVWVADEHWAFRFPQRAIGVPGIEHELAVLPHLAPLLPLPVPTPVFLGRPTDGYPWPFFGAALLPGREACELALDDEARIALARPLGVFLRRLHDPAVAEAVSDAYELLVDPNRRADMRWRVERTRAELAELERVGLWRRPAPVARLLEKAERLPAAHAVALVHGDLHFRHVLLDDEGRACGVIDWGDVCVADPAIDLQLVWSFLPPAGRRAFFDAYGPVTEEQLLRARVLSIFLCAVLARYGRAERLASVEREAIEGLGRATAD